MAAWVDCTSAPDSWFSGGYACDMGPYIGPWPMQPPGQTAGLSAVDGDAIVFSLGFDNPAAPGDPTQALDGTYDSPIWDAGRRLQDPGPPASTIFYDRTASGSAIPPAPDDTPPPGVHLWVSVYSSTEPPNPPAFYVPAEYAAGGVSALKTAEGRWSDWQPGQTNTHTADGAQFTGKDYSFFSSLMRVVADSALQRVDQGGGLGLSYPVPHDPESSLEPAALADMRAKIASMTVSNVGNLIQVVDYNEQASSFGNRSASTFVRIGAAQMRRGYKASNGTDAINPGPLIEGVDYQTPPWDAYPGGASLSGFSVESYAVTITWRDATNYAGGSVSVSVGFPKTDSFSGDAYSHEINFYVGVPPFADVLGTTYTSSDDDAIAWMDMAGLDLVDSPVLAWQADSGPGAVGSGTLDQVDLPLSTLLPDNTLHFGVAWQPSYVDTDAFGIIDNPTPSDPGGSGARNVGQENTDVDFGENSTAVQYDKANPRWRYYIPGAIVPTLAWHNFTGHYANFTGATHYIFTPGLGPVPMADGLPA